MAGPSEENRSVEVREEEMISPMSGVSSLRISYFLRPSVTSFDGPVFDPPFDCVNPTMIENSEPLKAKFVGWRRPLKDWKRWVYRMRSLHHSTWVKAGIHDAIMNSTFNIRRNDDLILGIAEKWCSKTNTFVFPWGEATITLEDMMFLGRFSVLGDSVLSSPGDGDEMIIQKLLKARADITRGTARMAKQSAWMYKFMDHESKIEHEAFLAYWLSRYVFPYRCDLVLKTVFPITVHLGRGTKIALAPAVLASIYKNLSSLKEAIVASRKLGTRKGPKEILKVKVAAPLQLVQAWVWERFPSLRPKPSSMGFGEPRLAQWHGLKKKGTENILLEIDCAAEDFIWRPYMRAINNSLPHVVCKEKDHWVLVDSGLCDEFEELVRCLRTSELVSLEVDCIEQYLPNRVAMQFGMDQDLPGFVARVNGSSEIAWSNYTRPTGDTILYIPARLFESDVTTRYLQWWDKLKFAGSGMTKAGLDGKSTYKVSKREEVEGFFKIKSEDNDFAPSSIPPKPYSVKAGISGSKSVEIEALLKIKSEDAVLPPPGFPPKFNSVKAGISGIKDKDTVGKLFLDESNGISLPRNDAPRKNTLASANTETKAVFHGHGSSERSKRKTMESLSGNKSDKDAHVPPPLSSSPKHTRVQAGDSSVKDNETRVVVNNRTKGHDKSCSQTKNEAPGMGLEERICIIEKLCDWLKAGNCHNRTKGHDESCSQTKNEAPGMGLEERICIIEKLCDWLKAGNCHLAENS